MPVTLQEVSVPTMAQESLRSMMVQLRQMEAQFNVYVRGLKDSLNLDGENWVLTFETMTFVKQPTKEQVNGVGAASSNSKGE